MLRWLSLLVLLVLKLRVRSTCWYSAAVASPLRVSTPLLLS